MMHLTLRNLVAHKMRMAATAFAVVLGVAFMAGTLLFTDTLLASVHAVTDEANREVDAVVQAPAPVDLAFGQTAARLDASLADSVRAVPGVDQAAVRVTGYAQVIGTDGELVGDLEQAPTFGFNWITVPELNPYRLVEGSPPTADHEIVVDRATAEQGGFAVGELVTVVSSHEPRQYTVAGIATFGSADSAAGATAVLFTEAVAMELLGSPGQVDSIAVTADGVDGDALAAAIRSALPDEAEVISGDQLRADERARLDEDFGPFRTFMLVFAFVAVFVGAFIINNTFSISVAQRTREMAMLRALGASRRQVLGSILTEAVAVGAVASIAGVAVGFAVAHGLRALITGAGFQLPEGGLTVVPGSMVLAFAVGLGVTVLSALLPARRASRIRPIAALRDTAIERVSVSVRRIVSGAVLAGVGVIALLYGLGQGEIALVGLGAVLILIGAAVLGPVVAGPATAAIGGAFRFGGLPAELATGNAARNPKRTARTASALMIGVALITFITVVASSFRHSFDAAIDGDLHGTHVVESGAFDGQGGFSPALADALRAADGVRLVTAARVTPALIEGRSMAQLNGFDGATLPDMLDLGPTEGDLRHLGPDGLAVSAKEAAKRGWSIGDVVPVTLPTGAVDMTVRAVVDDATWVGPVFVDTAAFDRYLPDQLDLRIYVEGDDAAVRAAAAPFEAEVLDRQAFADSVNGEIDQMLAVVYALLALAVVIALFGVANTIALSVHERTRELGLLRAVGMARRQIRAMVRGEASIVALYGTAAGAMVGVFFAWATVRALNDFGVDQFTLPYGRLALMGVLATLAGAGVALLPARRAARLDVLETLAAR